MQDELRPGYYKDHHGVWQRDRRVSIDRRSIKRDFTHKDRRLEYGRRKADQQIQEREGREAIREALEDFDAQHPG